MLYLTNIDLNQNELQNAVLQPLAIAPSNPKLGQVYTNSVTNKVMWYDGTAWKTIGVVVEDSETNGNIKVDGVEMSVYELPKATADTLGGVKKGNGLNIDSDGTLSVDVVDNLTSDDVNKPLSAAQGKALKQSIDSITGDIGELGGGDMMKATYDTDNDGVVDNAAKLGGQSPDYYAAAKDYLPLSGGTMTGDLDGTKVTTKQGFYIEPDDNPSASIVVEDQALTLQCSAGAIQLKGMVFVNEPTLSGEVANKQYVDRAAKKINVYSNITLLPETLDLENCLYVFTTDWDPTAYTEGVAVLIFGQSVYNSNLYYGLGMHGEAYKITHSDSSWKYEEATNINKNLMVKNTLSIENNNTTISYNNNYLELKTDNGVSINNKKIINLANGTDDTDAVNLSQLNEVQNAIPVKLSDLTNDENFIDNTVDNLVNYYKKSETLTKEEINTLIGNISTIEIQAVDSLPETGSSNVIYLTPKTNAQSQNAKDEWLWTGTAYEKIGDTEIDLSNYLTKTGDGSNVAVAFTQAESRENIATGEKLSILMGKLAKAFADLQDVAFSGSYNDLSDTPVLVKYGEFALENTTNTANQTFTGTKILNVAIFDNVTGEQVYCDVTIDGMKVTVETVDNPTNALRVVVMYV